MNIDFVFSTAELSQFKQLGHDYAIKEIIRLNSHQEVARSVIVLTKIEFMNTLPIFMTEIVK